MKLSRLAFTLSSLMVAQMAFAYTKVPSLINDDTYHLIKPGFYVGFDAGYGKVDKKVSGSTKTKNAGIVGGVNAGYQFNYYVAAEANFFYFQDQNFGKVSGADVRGKQTALGFAAVKGILPFGTSGFTAFGKLGAGAMHYNLDVSSSTVTVPDQGSSTQMVGVGVFGLGYAFNPNVEMHLQGMATTKSGAVPATYSALAGLSYHF